MEIKSSSKVEQARATTPDLENSAMPKAEGGREAYLVASAKRETMSASQVTSAIMSIGDTSQGGFDRFQAGVRTGLSNLREMYQRTFETSNDPRNGRLPESVRPAQTISPTADGKLDKGEVQALQERIKVTPDVPKEFVKVVNACAQALEKNGGTLNIEQVQRIAEQTLGKK